MSHAPGPWTVLDDLVKDSDSKNVACVLSDDHAPDARLIAAAPDLLAALERIQASPNDPAAHRMALDALKKAKGNEIVICGRKWDRALSDRGSCDGCGIPSVTTCNGNKNAHPCGLDWVLVRANKEKP